MIDHSYCTSVVHILFHSAAKWTSQKNSAMWLSMLLKQSAAVLPYLSFHINSSRYDDSSSLVHPLIAFIFIFALFQYDSTLLVWTPVGDTKCRERFTVLWVKPVWDCIWRYALHSSECTILPGATYAWIIGSKVALSRLLTIRIHCKNWVVGITTLRLLAHWFKFDNPKVVTQ